MKEILSCLLLVVVASVLGREVENKDRACPVGYFYGGEVTNTGMTRDQVWDKGPASSVYSCYRVSTGHFDWVNATKKCSEYDGQLLSVNNFEETAILTGDLFLRAAFGTEGEALALPDTIVSTSGISLAEGEWTWFGAGDSESSHVTQSITSNLNVTNTTFTPCLAVTFKKVANTSVSLEYTAVPCIQPLTVAICEARVYEQVWYVWFTTNWLQILFLITLVMLLVSTCITFQIWVSSPSRRRARESSSRPAGSPPAYIEQPQTNKSKFAAAADKYSEKGKELMAKVVFYRKPEDKQRLATDA